jgi:hypothetical protein
LIVFRGGSCLTLRGETSVATKTQTIEMFKKDRRSI